MSSGGGIRPSLRQYEGDKLIASYHAIRPEYPSEVRQQILQRSKGRRFMLDVGCGGGMSTGLFVDDFENILGIDISESQISFANRSIQRSNVKFQVVHDDLLPVDSNSVDLIFCGESFHFMNIPTFLSECERVLVPGGMLACVVYLFGALKTLEGQILSEFSKGSKLWKLQYDFHTNCGSDDVVRDTFHDRYESIFRSLENPAKEMLHIADVDVKYTTRMFLHLFSTAAGYMSKVFEDPEKDPIKLLQSDLKEILEVAGMNCEDTTEFVVTFRFDAMVVEKTKDFRFA